MKIDYGALGINIFLSSSFFFFPFLLSLSLCMSADGGSYSYPDYSVTLSPAEMDYNNNIQPFYDVTQSSRMYSGKRRGRKF